jgi:hypothetical protein
MGGYLLGPLDLRIFLRQIVLLLFSVVLLGSTFCAIAMSVSLAPETPTPTPDGPTVTWNPTIEFLDARGESWTLPVVIGVGLVLGF